MSQMSALKITCQHNLEIPLPHNSALANMPPCYSRMHLCARMQMQQQQQHSRIVGMCARAALPPQLSQAGRPGEGLRFTYRGCQTSSCPPLPTPGAQQPVCSPSLKSSACDKFRSCGRHRCCPGGARSRQPDIGGDCTLVLALRRRHVDVQEEEKLRAPVLRHRCRWTQEDLQGQVAAPRGGGVRHPC